MTPCHRTHAVDGERRCRTRSVVPALAGLVLALLALAAPVCTAQVNISSVEWEVFNPATSGIPGEEVRVMKFAPDGRMWVGARHPFWSDGGIGVYDFTQETWAVHSNVADSNTIAFASPFPNDIEFAPDGSVWCATENGLAHLVNGQWEFFTAANTPMPYHDIREIELDSQGRLWMNVRRGAGFVGSRIYVYDGTNWDFWEVGNGIPWQLPWADVTGVAVDANDHVWIGNKNQSGLAEFDGTTWTIHDGPGSTRIQDPFVDAFGDVWGIRVFGNSFYRFDGTNWTRFSDANTPFVNTTVTSISEDETGRLYVGNWLGQVIRQTAPGASTFELFTNVGNRVYNIRPQPSGEVYLTTAGAVRHLDASGVQLRAFNSWNTGLPDYFLDDFYTDNDDNIWVSTHEAGISRFDGERWRNWGAHNAGAEPYPWTGNERMGGIFIDSQGRGWMGGNGIGQWDPATGQFLNFWNWQNTSGFGVTIFMSFIEDINGEVLALAEHGRVYRFTGSTWVDVSNGVVFLSNAPYFTKDAAGTVYVPYQFDIYSWDGATWTKMPLPNPNYFFDLSGITAMAVGPDDTLWIGTGDGLVRLRNGVFTVFDEQNSPMPARNVRGIDVRDDGLVALAALTFQAPTPTSGVCMINGEADDPANWSIYRRGTHAIPHHQLGSVKFDRNGDLWVSAISEGSAIARITTSVCYADCDQSTGGGVLDVFDFLCFQNSFVNAEPYACDCDTSTGPGVCDVFDFLCFQDAFVAGCP